MDIILTAAAGSSVLTASLAIVALVEEGRRRSALRHKESGAAELRRDGLASSVHAGKPRPLPAPSHNHPRQPRPRLRRLTGEVARFSAVNTFATLVALVTFNVLVHGIYGWFPGAWHDEPIPAFLLANIIGMLVSYFGARYYAFRNRVSAGPGGGLLNYLMINLVSFVIPVTSLSVSRNLFGWDSIYTDNLFANVIGAVLGNAFRFWAFRRYVFTVRSSTATERATAESVPSPWLLQAWTSFSQWPPTPPLGSSSAHSSHR